MRDVQLAIVGGGPAGLAAAIEAAKRGIEAVILERREGVVDKACGEGLMPGAVNSLLELGVELPTGYPFLGVAYRDSTDESLIAEGTFSAGPGVGVRRVRLHEALRKAANSAGCETITHRVTSIRAATDHVILGPGIRTQWVIGADGLHSRVRREMGLDSRSRNPHRFGLRRHFHAAPWSDRVEVHWSHIGEAYVTPVAADLVGVAFLFTAPGRYHELLQHFPLLRARLADAKPATDLRGAGAFARRAKHVRQGRVLLVGDAAGYEDALTGEGIAIAIESARAAVAAIAEDRPHSYPRAYHAATRRWRWSTRALLALTRPRWTHRPLIHTLRAYPAIFDHALDSLAG